MNDKMTELEMALVESAIRWYLLWPVPPPKELEIPGTLARAIRDVIDHRKQIDEWIARTDLEEEG